MARARGYEVATSGVGLDGRHDGVELAASCDDQRFALDLLAADGARASVEFALDQDAPALSIDADFPSSGGLAWIWSVEALATSGGTAEFTAHAGAKDASSTVDRAGQWTVVGDAAQVNAELAPVLHASKIWHDAHAFAFASTEEGLRSVAADAILVPAHELAVPVPGVTRDKDAVYQLKTCGGALATCGIAALLKGAFGTAGGCLAGGGQCLAAMACTFADCEGDG